MTIASPFIQALKGKSVSHTWRGYGSSIFLEFGALAEGRRRKDGSIGNPIGELTLMLEWGWRIEKEKSILGSFCSSDRRMQSMLKKIIGAQVIDVVFYERLPEISVSLSNGLYIASFGVEGQPSWALLARNPKLGSLCVKRGYLNIEPL